MQADPIGIIPGLNQVPIFSAELNAQLQSSFMQNPLRHGINGLYAYVENNPLNLIDPLGLYGTQSCTFYQQRCEQVGGIYYCSLAPAVCQNAPPGPWADCVRQCLQECDAAFCETDNFGGGSDVTCVVNIHQICWQECIGGGPPGGSSSDLP